MNGKDMLTGMSFISDELVQEADSQPVRKVLPLKKWLPLAACLCLILTGVLLWHSQAFSRSGDGFDNFLTDRMESANEAMLDSQATLASGAETGIVWNSAVSAAPAEKDYPSPDMLYRNCPRTALPDRLLGDYCSDPAQAQPFIYRDGNGNTVTVYAEITHSILLPIADLITENGTFHPESYDLTMIADSPIHFFQTEEGLCFARMLLPVSADTFLLVTVSSEDLTAGQWWAAVTQLIEHARENQQD